MNSKFDIVQGRILGQSLIPFLMDVCYEVHLEEDKVNAINIMTVYAIDFATFSVKLSGFDNDKQNEKQTPACEHCKKPWHTKEQCWKLHDRSPNGRRRPPNDKSNPQRALMSESTSILQSQPR